jgi:hypothetical protein
MPDPAPPSVAAVVPRLVALWISHVTYVRLPKVPPEMSLLIPPPIETPFNSALPMIYYIRASSQTKID